jgi:hypothetical protein
MSIKYTNENICELELAWEIDYDKVVITHTRTQLPHREDPNITITAFRFRNFDDVLKFILEGIEIREEMISRKPLKLLNELISELKK